MATSEILRQLIQSHINGEDDSFRGAALRLIAEERQKNHNSLAAQLEHLLDGRPTSRRTFPPRLLEDLPKDREKATSLVDVRAPDRFLQEMVLETDTFERLSGFLREYQKADIIKTHGIRPRSKLLFCGPPGCGKTMCAEAIATELGLPMLYARFDAIVSSYLGETSSNLRKIFDFASNGTWVLFFDEFDAIGKSRQSAEEHGELKRVVNSFLQILDNFSSDSLVIAATNYEDLLDYALWRRFDDVLYFGLPSISQIRTLAQKKLANFPHGPIDFSKIARLMKGLSHADVERICLDAIRACIVNNQEKLAESYLLEAIAVQKKRLALVQNRKPRSVAHGKPPVTRKSSTPNSS